jgi:hypothetical protein
VLQLYPGREPNPRKQIDGPISFPNRSINGAFPVADLKAAVKIALQEYAAAGDFDELVRCISELASPHYHHEVIYRIVVDKPKSL